MGDLREVTHGFAAPNLASAHALWPGVTHAVASIGGLAAVMEWLGVPRLIITQPGLSRNFSDSRLRVESAFPRLVTRSRRSNFMIHESKLTQPSG